MKINSATKLAKTDGLVVFLFEKTSENSAKKSLKNLLPEKLVKEITKRLKNKDFKGKQGECLAIFDQNFAKKTYLIGLGEGKNLIEQRKSAGQAVKTLKKAECQNVAFVLPEKAEISRIIGGAMGANYEFKIGNTEKRFLIENLTLITNEEIDAEKLNYETSLADSVNTVRELVNLPPNILTTENFVERAKKLAKKYKNLKITILNQKKLEKLKMGGVLAVGQGSASDSYVVILEYLGGNKKDETTALIGKGVCYDSGGYNIKPTAHISTMKMDMGGAGTVFGIIEHLARTKAKKNVIGVLGLVENMINGRAYRPDDIITMYSGQTCLITNTDAEGRLVLADCLNYTAKKYQPAKMMDFATLTGACVVALGDEITGIMGNNQALVKDIEKSAKNTDELVWELPITDFFREKIKEEQADLQNWTAGVNAGSSMAGAFLENFVEKTPWVHFDIAGTAWTKAGNDYCPKGGTGAMVETVCRYFAE